MASTSLIAFAGLAAVAALPLSNTASFAADQFWDGNDTTANADGGNGTWNAVNTNWDSLAVGGVDQAWVPGNTAVFGGVAGTVTVSGTQDIAGLTFNTTGYVLSGGTLNLTAPATVTAGVGISATIGSAFSGANTLTKEGAGTVILGGNNSHSGTIINAGTVRVENNNALGSGDVDIAGGATLDYQNARFIGNDIEILSGAANFSQTAGSAFQTGQISGAGGLTKIGAGTLTLQTGNTYLGTTTVSAGTLSTGASNVLGAATGALVVNGGTLDINNTQSKGNLSGSGGIIDLGATLNINQTADLTYSGTFTGAGSFNKSGAGNLTLAGSSGTYTGTVTISAGTVTADTDTALGTGGVTLNGGTLATNGTRSIANNITLTAASGIQFNTGSVATFGGTIDLDSFALTVNAVGNGTFDGVISGVGGSLVKDGAGTLVLDNNNTYDGGTTINAGTVRVEDNGALGTGGVSMASGTTLDYEPARIIDNTISIAAGAATFNVNSGSASQVGVISGLGGLTKTGNGELVLEDTNTYQGTTTVSAGTLVASDTNALGAVTGALIVNAGTLELENNNSKGDLSGSGGNILLGAALSINQTNNLTYAGTFTGTGAFNKSGAGSLTLTGNSFQYDGATTISGGTLFINNSGTVAAGAPSAGNPSFGSTTSTVTVASGGTLAGVGLVGGDTTVQSGGATAAGASPGTLQFAGDLIYQAGSTAFFELGTPGTVNGVNNDLIVVGGSLTLDGTLNLTNPNAPGNLPVQAGYYTLYDVTGTTTGNFATVVLPNGPLPVNTSVYVTNGGAAGNEVNLLVQNGTQIVQFWDGNGTQAANGSVSGGAGTWNAANTNWTTPTGNINDSWRSNVGIFGVAGGAVTVVGTQDFQGLQFTANGYVLSGGTLNMIGDVLDPTASFINVDGSVTAQIDSTISGLGLDKGGAGTLILGGANTYTGLTTVAAGVLNIRNSTALGTTAGGTVVDTGAALELQAGIAVGAEALQLSGTGIGGNGALRNISGNNSWGGTVTLATDVRIQSDAGLLTLNAANAVTGAFNLGLGGAGDGAISGSITTGSGAVIKDGAGTWTLSGDNTFTGQLNVNDGVLVVNGAGSNDTLAVNVTGDAVLTVDSTHADGALADAAAVVMAGTSVFNVNNSETIGSLAGSAGTVVNIAGTEVLTTGGSGASTIFAGNILGAGGLTKLGGGIFELSGANAYFGPTTVSGGTLRAGATNTFSPNSAMTIDALATVELNGFSQTVAGLANAGTVNMNNGTAGSNTGDVLTVNGAYSGSGAGNLVLNIDLDTAVGTSDSLNILGASSGTTTVNFTNSQFGALTPDVLVIATTDGNLAAVEGAGLTDVGLVTYDLEEIGDDWFVTSELNLAPIGGIVGGISTAQSLINSAVNRPSSAFVTTPIDVAANSCAPGGYGRFFGGASTAESTTTSAVSSPATSEVDLTYGGAQIGVDFGCFNLGGNGAAVNVGVLGGINIGEAEQNQLLTPGSTLLGDNEFDSRYVGIYATFVKGSFFADAQLTHDWTDFQINSSIVTGGVPDILVNNQMPESQRTTVSGSAGYAFAFDSVSVVPSVGFAYSRTRTDTIGLVDNGGTLTFQDLDTIIGFASVAVAKTIILANETSAIQLFATGTVYNDFGDDQVVVYDDVINAPVATTTQNIGTFGELSLGLNYRAILEPTAGTPREVSTTLRTDFTFSDRLQGFRITAQGRVQF